VAPADIPSESEMAVADPKKARRWTPAMTAVFAGLLMVGGAGWWLILSRDDANQLSNETVAPATAVGGAGAERGTPAVVPSALRSSFHVDIKVEPATARIILDGKEVARGYLRLELPRDGQYHEIRLVANGYAPERLLFADAPPQRKVVLEPAADEREEAAPSTALVTRRPSRAIAPAARGARAGVRPEAAPALSEYLEEARDEIVGAAPPLHPTTPEPAPSVRIIEDMEPNVRVVE